MFFAVINIIRQNIRRKSVLGPVTYPHWWKERSVNCSSHRKRLAGKLLLVLCRFLSRLHYCLLDKIRSGMLRAVIEIAFWMIEINERVLELIHGLGDRADALFSPWDKMAVVRAHETDPPVQFPVIYLRVVHFLKVPAIPADSDVLSLFHVDFSFAPTYATVASLLSRTFNRSFSQRCIPHEGR